MEAFLSVQPHEEGASRIQFQSRDDGARPSWFRRALSRLLMCTPTVATDAPPPLGWEDWDWDWETKPSWRLRVKAALGSAISRVACVCKPGVHDDDDVFADPRLKRLLRGRGRRRRRRDFRWAVAVLEPDDYLTYGFRGSTSSMTCEAMTRRFALDEEAARRRMEMRQGRAWSPPGPSRLSQMSMADD